MDNNSDKAVNSKDLFLIEKGDWVKTVALVQDRPSIQELCKPMALSRFSGTQRRMALLDNPEFIMNELKTVLARHISNRAIQGGQFEVSISDLAQEIFSEDTEERRKSIVKAIGDLNSLLDK